MTANWLAANSRHNRTVEMAFLAFFIVFFAYTLTNWLGWLSSDRGFRPLQMVFLSATLLTQSVAYLLQPRSKFLSFALLAVSMLLLVAGFLVTS